MPSFTHRAYKHYLRIRLENVLSTLKHRQLRRILLSYKPLLDSSQTTNDPWTQPLLEHYLVQAEYRVASQTLPP